MSHCRVVFLRLCHPSFGLSRGPGLAGGAAGARQVAGPGAVPVARSGGTFFHWIIQCRWHQKCQKYGTKLWNKTVEHVLI